nr:Rab3 GTPase-activating protein non-catalytic subunit [Tanacetum cinerariifolium]
VVIPGIVARFDGSDIQLVYPGRILRLRVRGTNRDITEDTSSFEEVCVVIPGIVARFDGSDIQRVLLRWYQDTQKFEEVYSFIEDIIAPIK